QAPRPPAPRRQGCARSRPGGPRVLPDASRRGLPQLGGEPARARGAGPHAGTAPEAALPAVPLPRRAARRAGRRAGRLVRDLPWRRPLVTARGGNARPGAPPALVPRRSGSAALRCLLRDPTTI